MGAVLKIGDRQLTERELFPQLVKSQMMLQLARETIVDGAIAEIECTPEEKQLARQQFCGQLKITTEEQLQAWGKQNFMSPEQLEERIQRAIKLEKYKEATWGNKIESYFLQRKSQLDKVLYSLIRTQDPGVAQELYFRIKENETSFADLAKEYSQGSEAQTGGLIGPVELHELNPKVAKMLTNSKSGEVLPPARLGERLVIVRMEKFISAQLDKRTRQRLLEELFRIWLKQQLEETVSFEDVAQ